MKGKSFFIVGVQRSGTTLLQQLLSNHPDIYMEPRSMAFRLVTAFNNLYDLLPYNLQVDWHPFLQWLIKSDEKGRLAGLIDSEGLEAYGSVRELIAASVSKKLKEHDKQVWGDKAPNLQHFLKDLLLLLPEAKIIHIVRDGRANAYSMSTRSYRNLRLSAQQWVDGNSCGMVNQRLLGPDQYKMLRYEDLLTRPEAEMQAVCDFLGLRFAPEMLDLTHAEIPAEKRYVSNYFDLSKIEHWKTQLSDRQIRQIERIQGPLLTRLGYLPLRVAQLSDYRPLSLRRRIWYNQTDNFRQLLRPRSMGMKEKAIVEIRPSFKVRLYSFLTVLTRDLLAHPIFKSLFSRYFYRKKYYQKEE